MQISRYTSDGTTREGKLLATNGSISRIRQAVADGDLNVNYMVLHEGERLDVLAGRIYGDGRLWWIIAAASNVGWWLQVPAGTRIAIPTDLNAVKGLL